MLLLQSLVARHGQFGYSLFLKKAKTPCRMRGIPSNTRQVIKPMDYN